MRPRRTTNTHTTLSLDYRAAGARTFVFSSSCYPSHTHVDLEYTYCCILTSSYPYTGILPLSVPLCLHVHSAAPSVSSFLFCSPFSVSSVLRPVHDLAPSVLVSASRSPVPVPHSTRYSTSIPFLRMTLVLQPHTATHPSLLFAVRFYPHI